MNIEIQTQTKNPMLDRTEVAAVMSFSGATPSMTDVTTQMAKQCKAKEELVVVRDIYTRYGVATADIRAFVYSNLVTRTTLEGAPPEKKVEPKAEAPAAPKAEAKPAEAPKAEEKPAEAKTEAPKAEAKPAEEKKE
jgi:ribosomal protein S24E